MQEEKGQTPAGSKGEDAKADATSSETLSDVEKTEKTTSEKSDSADSSAPSPDGAFDSDQSGRGSNDDPGPM